MTELQAQMMQCQAQLTSTRQHLADAETAGALHESRANELATQLADLTGTATSSEQKQQQRVAELTRQLHESSVSKQNMKQQLSELVSRMQNVDDVPAQILAGKLRSNGSLTAHQVAGARVDDNTLGSYRSTPGQSAGAMQRPVDKTNRRSSAPMGRTSPSGGRSGGRGAGRGQLAEHHHLDDELQDRITLMRTADGQDFFH